MASAKSVKSVVLNPSEITARINARKNGDKVVPAVDEDRAPTLDKVNEVIATGVSPKSPEKVKPTAAPTVASPEKKQKKEEEESEEGEIKMDVVVDRKSDKVQAPEESEESEALPKSKSKSTSKPKSKPVAKKNKFIAAEAGMSGDEDDHAGSEEDYSDDSSIDEKGNLKDFVAADEEGDAMDVDEEDAEAARKREKAERRRIRAERDAEIERERAEIKALAAGIKSGKGNLSKLVGSKAGGTREALRAIHGKNISLKRLAENEGIDDEDDGDKANSEDGEEMPSEESGEEEEDKKLREFKSDSSSDEESGEGDKSGEDGKESKGEAAPKLSAKEEAKKRLLEEKALEQQIFKELTKPEDSDEQKQSTPDKVTLSMNSLLEEPPAKKPAAVETNVRKLAAVPIDTIIAEASAKIYQMLIKMGVSKIDADMVPESVREYVSLLHNAMMAGNIRNPPTNAASASKTAEILRDMMQKFNERLSYSEALIERIITHLGKNVDDWAVRLSLFPLLAMCNGPVTIVPDLRAVGGFVCALTGRAIGEGDLFALLICQIPDMAAPVAFRISPVARAALDWVRKPAPAPAPKSASNKELVSGVVETKSKPAAAAAPVAVPSAAKALPKETDSVSAEVKLKPTSIPTKSTATSFINLGGTESAPVEKKPAVERKAASTTFLGASLYDDDDDEDEKKSDPMDVDDEDDNNTTLYKSYADLATQGDGPEADKVVVVFHNVSVINYWIDKVDALVQRANNAAAWMPDASVTPTVPAPLMNRQGAPSIRDSAEIKVAIEEMLYAMIKIKSLKAVAANSKRYQRINTGNGNDRLRFYVDVHGTTEREIQQFKPRAEQITYTLAAYLIQRAIIPDDKVGRTLKTLNGNKTMAQIEGFYFVNVAQNKLDVLNNTQIADVKYRTLYIRTIGHLFFENKKLEYKSK